MRKTVYLIIIIVSIFLTWAYFAKVDEVVRGRGKVIPSSQTKIIQHLEGGIVEKIYVKEGDKVKKGSAIYRLKNAFSQSDLKVKEIDLFSLKVTKQRLESQIAFKKKLIFPKEMMNKKLVLDEIDIFNNEMKRYFEQNSILENKLFQARLEKKKAKQKLANLKTEYRIAQENLRIMDNLRKKGAASKQQYLNQLAKKQSLYTQVSDLKSSLEINTQKIEEASTNIYKFKSETKSKWLKELSDINLKIEKLKQKSEADEDREKRKVVVSPVDGIVKKLYFHTIGGIIKSGDRLAEITPIDDSLIIEAKIKTNDIAKVWVNQDVSIEITAYNYSKYGMIKGKVISISPDSFTDRDNSMYYLVRVKADHYEFAPDKLIVPGMVANINILTGKRTIMEYLLQPFIEVSKHAFTEK